MTTVTNREIVVVSTRKKEQHNNKKEYLACCTVLLGFLVWQCWKFFNWGAGILFTVLDSASSVLSLLVGTCSDSSNLVVVALDWMEQTVEE